jgi:hypothetical protein
MIQSEVNDQDKMFQDAWNEANIEPEEIDAPAITPDQSDPFALGWGDGEKYASADIISPIGHKTLIDAGAETVEDAFPDLAKKRAAKKELLENAPKPAGQTGLSTRSPEKERAKRAELARKGIMKKTDQDLYLLNHPGE